MSMDPNLERTNSARKSGTQPTSKELTLKQDLENARLKNNDKDSEIKKLKADNRQLQLKIDNLEKTNVKNFQKLDQEKKIRTSAVSEKEKFEAIMGKMQLAVSARLKLLGVDFDKIGSVTEALDAAFNAINRLVAELQDKENFIAELQDEQTKLKNVIEKQKAKLLEYENEIEKQKQMIDEQKKRIEEQDKTIRDMKESNNKLTNENSSLKQQVNLLLDRIAKEKNDSTSTFDDMAQKLVDLQLGNAQKDNTIKDLEYRIRQLETETQQQKITIEQRNQQVATLTNDLNKQNAKVNELTIENEKLRQRVKELENIVNVPKFDKVVQTDISGAIEQQLSDYPRLLKEIVALKQAVAERNERINNLEEENRLLLAEIDTLLKKAARFYPCKTNHVGEICILRAHPKRYLVATGGADMSCRLWRVDPDSSKRKVVVTLRSIVDGILEAIAFSDDGTLLAGGTGYNDGPDGYVIIWSFDGSYQEGVVLHTIRSRPTVRFGRVRSIAFSSDKTIVYCGDVTGKIWCFNIEEEKLIAVIHNHNDIVYDIAINTSKGYSLYSVSHDQSLSVFELPSLIGGSSDEVESGSQTKNKNGNKSSKKGPQKSVDLTEVSKIKDIIKKRPNSSRAIHVANISVEELLEDKLDDVQQFKGNVIQKDSRYPFWRVAISSDGKYVCCASRKVNIFLTPNDFTADLKEGSRVTDSDSDHVRSLRIRGNYLLISRASVPRAKIFSLNDGKEFKNFQCKKAVSQCDFLCNDSHIIICQQEAIPNQSFKPCIMKVVQYSTNQITSIPKEPTTPRDDDEDDETVLESENTSSNNISNTTNNDDTKDKDENQNQNSPKKQNKITTKTNTENDTSSKKPSNAKATNTSTNSKKTADKGV